MTDEKPPETRVGTSNVASLAAAKLKKARAKKAQPPTDEDDGRPLITLARGKLPQILDEADAALGAHDSHLFDHFGRMVRLTEPDQNGPVLADLVQRKPGAILLRDVTVPNLNDRLARVARWQRWDTRAGCYVTADVPVDVAQALLARSGEWRKIPPLRGFVEAPTLRDDGSVFDAPGYDKASQLFFVGSRPSGYSTPCETREHARDALEKLQAAFYDLPFVDEQDKAAAYAAVLTALVRRVLPSAPLVGITAPAPGTGKSLLADAISIIATGRRAAVLGLGKDDIEGDKRLTSALLAGDAVIAIDNVERPMFGDLICQALTQPNIRIRPLGSGHLVSTPTNIMLMVTANNLDVRGDLRRRVMLLRLDARVERPELRRFTTDFLQEITRQRGELVQAALTIIRAYLASGDAQSDLPTFGGFEHWSRWCREPLTWLGLPDPLFASEELRAQDPDIVVQQQFFAAWFRVFEEEPVTAAGVIKASDPQLNGSNDDLRSALDTVCAERIAPRRLTYWLRKHQGRMVDGMRLVSVGMDKNHTMLWKLEKC